MAASTYTSMGGMTLAQKSGTEGWENVDNGAAGFASKLTGSALAVAGVEPWIPAASGSAVSGVEVRDGGGGGVPDDSSVDGSGGEGAGGELDRVMAGRACGEGASDGTRVAGSGGGGRGGSGGRFSRGGGGDARKGWGGGGGGMAEATNPDAPHAKMRPSAFPNSS